MKKQIIGYELKDMKYLSLTKKLCPHWDYECWKDFRVKVDSGAEAYLKDLGLLDLWFKPVYQEEFKVGNIVVSLEDVEDYRKKGEIFKVLMISRFPKGNIYYKKYAHGSPESFRLASTEEIKKYENNLLLEEAKLKYVPGIKINSIYGCRNWLLTKEMLKISPITISSSTKIVGYGLTLRSSSGKWAEILPSTPQIQINGYIGEFFDNYVEFGCAKIHKELFTELYKTVKIDWNLYGNKNIESVTIGKGVFSKEQIKEIALYYLEKNK